MILGMFGILNTVVILHVDCNLTLTFFFFFLAVFGFRIYVTGEGYSCDILCNHSSIFGCETGININGCISGLPTNLAGNLFACWWLGCCRTSKILIFKYKYNATIGYYHLSIFVYKGLCLTWQGTETFMKW